MTYLPVLYNLLFMYNIEQTVDIPAEREIFLKLPETVPVGRATIRVSVEECEPCDIDVTESDDPTISCRLLAKQLGLKLTSDMSLAWRREDRDMEEAEFLRN